MGQRRRLKPPRRGGDWRTFGTSTFQARPHLEETVRGADGERYRLRLARTGIHRRLWGAPINHILSDISWIRFLVSKDRSWTLTVAHRGEWGDRTVLEERFDQREEGGVRAEGVVELLLNNPDFGAGLRGAGS